MHELGILYQAVKTADQVARENGIQKVAALQMEVGELSGCIPRFFEMYYPMVSQDFPTMDGSELVLTVTRGEGLCRHCGNLFHVMTQEGKCPVCGSRDKKILGGQECLIKNLLF